MHRVTAGARPVADDRRQIASTALGYRALTAFVAVQRTGGGRLFDGAAAAAEGPIRTYTGANEFDPGSRSGPFARLDASVDGAGQSVTTTDDGR